VKFSDQERLYRENRLTSSPDFCSWSETGRQERRVKDKTVNNSPVPGSFDDLVFENRNKEYGAYQLRKRYNSVLFTGTVISSLLGIAAVLIPFLARPNDEHVIVGGSGYYQVTMQNLEPPQEKVYVPPPPPASSTAKMPEPVQYVPPVVVDSVMPVEAAPITTDAALASLDKDVLEVSGSGDGIIPEGNGTGNEEPMFIVEVMPSFKGGDFNRFADWVQKRTNYPQAAIDQKIRGIVYLTFIVEKDGSVSNVTVIKGVHPLLDNEAVKVISESPKWSPGLQRGQPVRVRFQIPLSFLY
jgi:periplasmic protein TonB